MSRSAACPKCRNQFTLPELAGPATIACPFCGAHINIKVKPAAPIVPQAPPPAVVVQPAMAVARAIPVEDDEDEVEEEEYRPKKKKKKGAKSSGGGSNETGMKIAIVAGILLLTVISIVFAFWWFLRDTGPRYIMPSKTSSLNESSSRQTQDDVDDDAEATGSERFEIADKLLVHQDLIKSYSPDSNLPGLQKDAVKESGDTLSKAVLDKVEKATVYIETESQRGTSSGSGFFACEKGFIVTNAHVIDMLAEGSEQPRSVRVFINHGKSNQQDYKAAIGKVDRKNDLAILRLPGAYKETYPAPLQLASSLTTQKTQKVFAMGYPLGKVNGKEITVTTISVSSHRFQNGRINVIQFAGAPLNPGNSGGPIVDITGRVIGVAVRISIEQVESRISNTGISFGVPCDEVAALYYGRADRLDLFPPTRKNGSLQLPVLLQMTEHSSRSASPKVMVTPGDESKPPESSNAKEGIATLKSGESKQIYAGSIDVPDLEAGKVYWIQPQVTFGENQVTWLEPKSYKPGKILDDTQMPLATGSANKLGTLKLQQRYEWNVHDTRGSAEVRLDYAAMTEGDKEELKDLRLGAKISDRFYSHRSLQQMWSNRLPENESYAQSRGGIKLTTALRGNLNQWHDIAELNIPRESVEIGKKWKTPNRTVILDYMIGFDANQQCALNCEYLGSFKEDTRTIGVIRLQGDLTDTSNSQAAKTPFGKMTGLALVDTSTRELLDFMLRCDARKRTTNGNSSFGTFPSIDGVMQLRLQRKAS